MTTWRRVPILLAVFCLTATATNSGNSPEQWRQDLDYLAKELPIRHKNLFSRLTREQWDDEVRSIRADLPSMSDVQVRTALQRLVASAANAHTGIASYGESPLLPLVFRRFGNDYYVTAAEPRYAEAIGSRVLGIGKNDFSTVTSALLPLIPRENDLFAQERLAAMLRTVDALHGTGLIEQRDAVDVWLEKDKRNFHVSVPPVLSGNSGFKGGDFVRPLWLSNSKLPYWFQYLDQEHALYIQYNSCTEMLSLPFSEFTRKVMEVADREPVNAIVIDLRRNGGGDSALIHPLLKALKQRPHLWRDGHLFVLTSPETFSSALMNALTLKQNFKATVAGQPSSQELNTYGDIRTFRLPNSGLEVSYCTKYFGLMPGKRLLEPDLPVPLTAEDYFAGRDAVLETVLRMTRAGPN